MVFGALCNALLSCFCGSSEEQRGRPDNFSLHAPAAAYKPYQPVTKQPPQQPQPAYKPYQYVTEQPLQQPQPAYKPYQRNQPPQQYRPGYKPYQSETEKPLPQPRPAYNPYQPITEKPLPQPPPAYKSHQRITDQPPQQYRPGYKSYQPVKEKPLPQPQPAYNPYQPIIEKPLSQPQPAYKPYQHITDQPPQQCWLGYEPYQPVTEQPPCRPAQYPPKPARPSPPVNTAEKNHDNENYQDLRTRAKNEGAEMARCFEESHVAYARKDSARAKELSIEGKAHHREMERLNAQASEWIFNENNMDRKPGEVDLHDLYVREAITFTERAINDARQCGIIEIHLIVGKGLHSSDGVAKLKPAIQKFLRKQGLITELDQNNSGVLIVNLSATRAVKL